MQAPLRLMCRFFTRTSPFAASLLFLPDTKPITNTSRGGRRARHPKTHYPTVFLFSSRRDACRITSWRTKLADQPASSRRNSLCLNSCPCRCCLPGFVGFERFVFPTLAATPHTCICACLCACTSTCTCTCAGGTCELAKSRGTCTCTLRVRVPSSKSRHHARTAVPCTHVAPSAFRAQGEHLTERAPRPYLDRRGKRGGHPHDAERCRLRRPRREAGRAAC